MKRFFSRIHYLITSPGAFYSSYSTEPVSRILRHLFAVGFVMLALTALIRTETAVMKLPALISSAFPGVSVINGKLSSAGGFLVPEPWRVSDISAVFTGRTDPLEMFGDSSMVVDTSGAYRASMLFTADSIHFLGFMNDQKKVEYRYAASWKEATRGVPVHFTEDALARDFSLGRPALFISMFLVLGFYMVGDLLNLWLLLFLIVLLYRRELSQVWAKKSTIKILLNGTIPYFVLMPVFAASGNHAELLSTAAAVISTIIISRSFNYHRMTLYSENRKDI